MGELPERWTEGTPERHLFDRTPTFGLARHAEQLPAEAPPALAPAEPPAPPRERGPFLTALFLPWSYGRNTGGRWNRMKCRWGRHEMGGGEEMQLGGTVVFIERRCRWCGAAAGY